MQSSPGKGDKSVFFSLPTAEAAVFFNKEVKACLLLLLVYQPTRPPIYLTAYSSSLLNHPPTHPPTYPTQLVPIFEVLASLPDGTGLQGHTISRGNKGAIEVTPIADFEGDK